MSDFDRSQKQEVIAQRLESDDFGEYVRRIRISDLKLDPKACQGTTQFMGGVGDECLLLRIRGLDPTEHVVHRGREPGDSVTPRRDGNPTAKARSAYCGDLPSD